MAKREQEDRGELFRLTEIVTEEVSLVDRPANLQPFLIVKRDESSASSADAIVVKPDGTMVSAEPTDKSDDEPKPDGAESDNDSSKTGTEKAGRKMSAARYKDLERAVEILLALKDSLATKEKEARDDSKTGRKKGDGDERSATLDKATAAKIDNIVGTVDKLAKSVESHERRLRQGVKKGKRQAGVRSNAMPIEKSQSGDEDVTTWPMDMNRE